jgi:hypothetical protein
MRKCRFSRRICLECRDFGRRNGRLHGLRLLAGALHALLKPCGVVAELMRNAPTFVYPFYRVFMLQGELPPPFATLGIPSVVRHRNTVVNATGTTDMMLWVYLYAMAGFFLFGYPATTLIRKASDRLDRRFHMPGSGVEGAVAQRTQR